jgi:hypothetical protein
MAARLRGVPRSFAVVAQRTGVAGGAEPPGLRLVAAAAGHGGAARGVSGSGVVASAGTSSPMAACLSSPVGSDCLFAARPALNMNESSQRPFFESQSRFLATKAKKPKSSK